MTLKFIRTESIGSIKSGKGTLILYPDLRPDDFFSLQEETPNIEKVQPKEYIKNLFQYLCHYEKYLPQDNRSIPLKPSLSKDDISSLTDKELNELASIYLKHRKHDQKEIRKDNETDIEYIHRLDIAQRKRRQKASDLAKGKYSGLFTISDAVTQQLSNSLVAAEALQKSTFQMDEIGKAARNHKSFAVPISSIPDTSLEIRRELQKLVEVSSLASDFAIKSHKAQLSINDAIVSSGKETSNLAQKGIRLTIAVIVITILIPVITTFFIDPSNQKFINEKTSLIVNKLDSINSNLNQTTIENKKLSSVLQKQNVKITSLSEKNISQEKTINQLKARLKTIEQAAKHKTVPVK